MTKKYIHPLTKDITPDNWTEKMDLNALSLDDCAELYKDFKNMEAFGKKLGGYLREAVNARMKDDEFETPRRVKVVRTVRVRKGGLDVGLIEEEMGQEWVEEHRLPETEYFEIRASLVEED